jgi:hypothetical protein
VDARRGIVLVELRGDRRVLEALPIVAVAGGTERGQVDLVSGGLDSALVLRSTPLTSQMSVSSADGSVNASVGVPDCLLKITIGYDAPAGASWW